jgi:hypothetical protein
MTHLAIPSFPKFIILAETVCHDLDVLEGEPVGSFELWC